MDIEDLKLNRPDVSMANRIKAVFEDDPQISIEYVNATEDQYAKIILKISNSTKAVAIGKILPEKYDISLPLLVEVVDTSKMDGDVVRAAFSGNPHFKNYVEITNELTKETYHICVFKEEVIKFLNDNAASLNGYEFRLMQDLCEEIAPVPKLIYTTDDGLPFSKLIINS